MPANPACVCVLVCLCVRVCTRVMHVYATKIVDPRGRAPCPPTLPLLSFTVPSRSSLPPPSLVFDPFRWLWTSPEPTHTHTHMYVHTHRHTQTHTTQTTKFYNNTHTPHVHREDHWLSLEPVLPPTQAPTLSTAPDLVRLALNHSSPSSVSGRGLESRTWRALSKVAASYPQIPPSQVSQVSLSLCMCVQMKECVLLDR